MVRMGMEQLLPLESPYFLTFTLGELITLLFSVFQIGYLLGCKAQRTIEPNQHSRYQAVLALPPAEP